MSSTSSTFSPGQAAERSGFSIDTLRDQHAQLGEKIGWYRGELGDD